MPCFRPSIVRCQCAVRSVSASVVQASRSTRTTIAILAAATMDGDPPPGAAALPCRPTVGSQGWQSAAWAGFHRATGQPSWARAGGASSDSESPMNEATAAHRSPWADVRSLALMKAAGTTRAPTAMKDPSRLPPRSVYKGNRCTKPAAPAATHLSALLASAHRCALAHSRPDPAACPRPSTLSTRRATHVGWLSRHRDPCAHALQRPGPLRSSCMICATRHCSPAAAVDCCSPPVSTATKRIPVRAPRHCQSLP